MTILDDIVADKRNIVARAKRDTPVSDLEGMPLFSRPTLDLRGSLTAAPVFALIAEIKRASPSAGQIRRGVDVAEIAREYVAGGAAHGRVIRIYSAYLCGRVPRSPLSQASRRWRRVLI